MWSIDGRRRAAWLMILAATGTARADVPAFTARLVPEIHQRDPSSTFDQPALGASSGQERGRVELELRWAGRGANLVATGRGSFREEERPRYAAVLNELYWDGDVLGQHVTAGKKIMSWDVGFGFRPLDVLQRDDRRVLFASAYEGVPVLVWERFDAEAAWTVAYANPAAGRRDDPRDDESFALRYYRHLENLDLYAIGRGSERARLEAGLAASYVAHDGLELHGSFRYQRRSERALNRLAEERADPPVGNEPVVGVVDHDTVAALLGATWSHASGLSLIGEWWYDPAAHDIAEWRNVFDLARRQAAMPPGVPADAIAATFAANFKYFEQPNLLPHNVLLRLSHTRETLECSFDLLWTPEDDGIVATLSLGHRWNRQRVTAGLRTFAGARASVYRSLPEDAVLFMAWEIAY